MTRLLRNAFACAIATLPGVAFCQYDVSVVMSGLDNPRGVAIDHLGNVYVAEAGSGGGGAGFIGGEGTLLQYGATGAVSRLFNGVQQRIMTGLPSLAYQGGTTPGSNAIGLHHIAFDAAGDLYGAIGLNGTADDRSGLGEAGALFGTIDRLPIGGPPVMAADLAAFEAANNPDGETPESDPYGFFVNGSGFTAVDAGGNDMLRIQQNGAISVATVFPDQPNPLPFGPPFYQSVPVTVAHGPDGSDYVGEFTGFPFPQAGANIYRIDAANHRSVAFGGFTNIIDMTFGVDGNLYVLQFDTNGLAAQGGPGAGELIRVNMQTGDRTLLLSDPLFMPGGIVAAADGSFYISNFSTDPSGGQLLHVTPVPEPASIAMFGIGIATFLGRKRRRR